MGDRNSWGSEALSYDLQDDDENGNGGNENDVSFSGDSALASVITLNATTAMPVAGTEHELHSVALASKLLQIHEEVLVSREDILELRQQANDLQEYSKAKISRVCRYLGVLAEKAHKLDQVVLEGEAQLSFLRKERKKLFNDLLSIKGNIQVYCRVRPPLEHEGPSIIEFLNDFLIQVNTSHSRGSYSKREFEFDRVYGPHVSQGDIFHDIQPFVRSALDGYNVCIIAYGQSGSGKTYTIEGPSNDRGVLYNVLEELFDLSNNETTSTSSFSFSLSMFEVNHEVVDLLCHSVQSSGTVQMGYNGKTVEVSQERVENLAQFAKVYNICLLNRKNDASRIESTGPTHLVVTFHIQYTNNFSGEKKYSKVSIVEMVGNERFPKEEGTGDRLGDVLSALTAKKEYVPYENSLLTQILSDSLGGDAKSLLIVNVSSCQSDLQETLASLNFAAKARNMNLSLGNQETIKMWRDMANEARKELYEKEKEVREVQHQAVDLKKSLTRAEDQCLLLFNEVQKAWKVAFSLQADHKNQTAEWIEKEKNEKEQNAQLKAHISQLVKSNEEQKRQLQEYSDRIHYLEGTVQDLNQQLKEARKTSVIQERDIFGIAKLRHIQRLEDVNSQQKSHVISEVTKRLDEELSKRDELIERLHEENERLFERITDRSVLMGSSKVQSMVRRNPDVLLLEAPDRGAAVKLPVSLDKRLTTASLDPSAGILTVTNDMSLAKSGAEKVKTTPAGEYLTGALNDFSPDPSDGSASADGANKLLMLVLAAVIKAGAAREHEMLAEIRNAVFAFIRKMEPLRVMDTMLVSRVRILYIRSLLSRTQELQTIKVPPADRFLEKVGHGSSSRTRSSQGSSPARSPVQYERNFRKDIFDEHIQPFKVYIKQEKRSKFSSIVLKLRGIDQETWRQHVTGGKLRETTEEARNYAIGNKALAALFVHTPAGELQRQIRNWLAENFDFLSMSSGDISNGTTGQLELLSTAIMDGWMSGLGVPQRPSTDALGRLLSDYTKRVYTSQLQHLKEVAATLATEEADDLGQISKLRSALEAVEHKRRKILQQMRSDVALLTKDEGGSPIRNPSTASEDARIASLMSLEDILKHAEELKKEAPVKAVFSARKQFMLSNLQALYERMPSLLSIDHPCAQRHILEAQRIIESIAEQRDSSHHTQGRPGEFSSVPVDWAENLDSDIMQWSVLQFNTGAANPFVIKCSATASLELVVKAQAKIEDKGRREMISIVPAPSTLAGLSLEEIKQVLARLPEAFSQLALTKSADGTRARYARLYKTLATRVPALKNTISDADREYYSREYSNASMSFKRVG